MDYKKYLLLLSFTLNCFAGIETEAKITASFSNKGDKLSAVNDGVIPASSTDFRIPRQTFWPKVSEEQWLQYDFEKEEIVENVAVYWFDEAQGASVVLPQSWQLIYFDGSWNEAEIKGDYGTQRDKFNIVELSSPVKATKLKLLIKPYKDLSVGVMEWKVNVEIQTPKITEFINPDKELSRLKATAKNTLTLDVDEFNGYSNLNRGPNYDGWLKPHNNEEFLQKNIPKFICSDEDFTEVYNYRWWMTTKRLKEHQDKSGKFYVYTEFPGVPGWASKSGAIPAPAGHQFYDIRWMRDPKYLKSYIEYWMFGSASRNQQRQNHCWLGTLPRPESHHYTSWMVDGAEALLKIHPDSNWRDKLLPAFERHQKIWDDLFLINAPDSKTHGMYKCLDMYDANEFTISTTLGLIAAQGSYKKYSVNGEKGKEEWRKYFTDGNSWKRAYREGIRNKKNVHPQPYNLKNLRIEPQAFGGNHKKVSYPNSFTVRPSLNSYMFANYKSLGTLYRQQSQENQSEQAEGKSHRYFARANDIKNKILDNLWYKTTGNEPNSFYTERGNIDEPFFYSRLAGDNKFTGGVKDTVSLVRESVAYMPWYFNMMPKGTDKYDVAWKQFADPMGFNQKNGMSTAEYRHDYFNEMTYGWNGRGWPFQNSVAYKAYGNYLRNYKGMSKATAEERDLLYSHIRKYVDLHGRRRSIGEWYLPRTGGFRMPGGGPVVQSKTGQGKSFGDVQDYFHSTFPDTLIEDLLGFRSSHKDLFSISPLLPEDKWDYFYLGEIRYHNHDIDIIWKKDWNKSKAGNQSELCIWVDGKIKARSTQLNKTITVSLK